MRSDSTCLALAGGGLLVFGVQIAAGLADPPTAAPEAGKPTAPGPSGLVKQPTEPAAALRPVGAQDQDILAIAHRYTSFTLANPRPQWAIALCRALQPSEYPPLPSRSADPETHGRKVYMLWVQAFDAYLRTSGVPRGHDSDLLPGLTRAPDADVNPASPVGQTLVKETFETVEVSASENRAVHGGDSSIIKDGDRSVRKGAPAELFIMTKLDPKAPGTDKGWIYAVVSADRKSVLRSGCIESCMKCHDSTTRDRLYGPEGTWPKDSAGKPTPPVFPPAAAPAKKP